MKKNLLSLFTALLSGTLLFTFPAIAQLTLSGTNYTQDFNQIASGLPAGWSVRTGATASSIGTAATFNTAAVSWGTSTGQFGNQAGTTNNAGAPAASNESNQPAYTNRCPAIRQTGSFGDPGAAFVLQIANTLNVSNLAFSVDFNMLSVQTHSTTWTIDYAVGNSPGSFTTLGTYSDPGVFGTTTASFSLGANANNQANNVWIRIVALTASSGSSGSRDTFGIDNFNLNYAGPSAPTISSEPAGQTSGVLTTVSFTVAASGNPPLYYQWFKGADALSDGGNISGATNDTLTLANIVHADAGDYFVVVSNYAGAVTSSIANLAVVGFAVTPLPPTNVLAGTSLTVPLVFFDNQSPITTITGSSGNQAILPDANISGTASTATLTPPAGGNSVVLVSLTASDGTFSTNIIFPLLVVPSTNVVFNDHFDYANGATITNSYGIWRHHSPSASGFGESIITNGALQISRSFDEDINAGLIGQPFDTNETGALYSRFNLKLTTLPTPTGNYFAHFKDNTTSNFCTRVWISTANTNTGGTYRLGIGNAASSTATSAQFPMDLSLNTNYTVVTRLVLSNGVSTLWINPAAETDASVTAADTVNNLVAVTSYAFRQDSSEGVMQVDDLVVATTFNDALGIAPSAFLQIQTVGTNVVLTWTDSSFVLQSAPAVTGTYTNEPGATSPFTNGITGSAKFYRLTP